tara:strand:- start:189 stop:362 length:174 start_codon:yes stop_codon:yes gene_type:complete
MKKWEYKIEMVKGNYIEIENELKRLGLDGWEIVSTDYSPIAYEPNRGKYLVIFKREI